MILLDTSVLIELYRKKNKEKTLFYRLAEYVTDFSISSVTHYEIGIGNKSFADHYSETLFASLVVVPLDKSCSITAIDIYLDLKKKNKLIDLADLLIGATAVTFQYPIATLNRKHFERIPGISIIELDDLKKI
jgi:tRNA(fMet)-specific endonuclease VapC